MRLPQFFVRFIGKSYFRVIEVQYRLGRRRGWHHFRQQFDRKLGLRRLGHAAVYQYLMPECPVGITL
jgi:hypothetical protein